MFRSLFLFALFVLPLSGEAASISISSSTPMQGEPILVTVEGVSATSSIRTGFAGETSLHFFLLRGKPAALYGIDLKAKTGTSTVSLELTNGEKLFTSFRVVERPFLTAPLGIPEKLGGNTKVAAKKLIANLVNEQAILNGHTKVVRPKGFWKNDFIFPVEKPIVTDTYGYARDTVGYSIAHKGADFRAKEGTKVGAINRGVVRMKGEYPTFGKMVVVDHGLGLYSIYLHLSKISVNVGQLVLPGQIIGFSGQTGYAINPHFHLSIRMNGNSVDPIEFYSFFGKSVQMAE